MNGNTVSEFMAPSGCRCFTQWFIEFHLEVRFVQITSSRVFVKESDRVIDQRIG